MNKTIYMKIFLNYLQVLSLAKGFNLNWPDAIKEIFKAQGQVSEVSQQILAMDCFLSSKAKRILKKYLTSWISNQRCLL